MDNKDKKRIQNLTSALYKRDMEVGKACGLMRGFDYLLSTALDALRNIKASSQDEACKVIQERVEVVIKQCREYVDDHDSRF